ncbi:TetR/AcrR family transcriptional regulator [Azoarcus sp. DN11]|uniref:TetR/AcrR family transcriptional regulator n=1 Tax=Azoarcus sp. DN11 TaxID=356837 RepID=UPI000EACFD77|nr:TetR/AcrR family transcriptional regulator [Azoarcus sp. DN11]AYH42112.1 TetR family transcriptional regulator [Azoarcus sp. DN11]
MARGKAPTFELQRATMLRAAAGLFAEKGFHNASMSAIAQACGVSKPLLYHYYRDKEHLLFDIADSYIDELLAIVAAVEARKLAAEDHFAELVRRFMEEYEHAQDQHMVIVQDVKFLREEQAASVAGKQRRVVAAFADALARVEPGLKGRKLDKAVTMILFGMINWTFTWLRADGPLTFRDMAPIVTQIFLNGVRGLMKKEEPAASEAG